MKFFSKFVAAVMCSAMVLTGFPIKPLRAAEGDIPIDAKHFPDPNFRACVARNSDTDGNNYLDKYEILYTWNMYCENSGVNSIEGIEYFPYLKGLWCKGNNITEIDLSNNPDIEGVWCSFNPLSELDFSGCPKLSWIYCFDCNLEKLNVRNNPKLAYLECNSNPNLTELDLSQNPELENLFCSNCGLTELDVSNNPLLNEITCYYNDLETLDVSNNPLIKRLDVWHNERLKDIDVSNLKEMQYYNIAWTAAKNVNVRSNKHLLELVCGYNDGITSLDLSQNADLAFLTVECDTKLRSLDLSHNPKLYYLMAFGLSSIDDLDFSKNYHLCKAYNEGKYVHETENLGYVYSMTIDYGGSSDPFDELRHCVALDDRVKVNAKFNGTIVPDCKLDTNDGLSNNETFITRGQAIQTLYELAGKPAAPAKTRFTDVPSDASYYAAVKWGEANNICFGYPVICDNEFAGEELINRQDFALMAHRFADYMHFGTAFDYGRSDWFKDSLDMDFYAWGPFTWALQWKVVHIEDNDKYCLPHGRISYSEFKGGLENLMDLDSGATYAQRVGGNFGEDGDPNATEKQGTGYIAATGPKVINIAIPTTYPGSKAKDKSKETPATTTTTTTTKTPSTVVETPEVPVSSTDKPAATKETPSTTEKPAATKETPGTTEKPAATKETPSTTEKPAATKETPSTTEKPAATKETPGATEKPVSTKETPSNTEKPVASTETPATVAPVGTTETPATETSVTAAPVATTGAPATAPVATTQEPATSNENPNNTVAPVTTPATPETPVATVKPVTTIVKDAFGNKIVSENKKEQQILALKGAKSAPGATFSILQAKQKKVTNDSITISWKKANGAKSYIVYGSKSGKTDKYVKLKTVTGTSFTQKKLKKGTYYKYVVVAVGNGKALATSKTLYIATKGGMVGNYKTITTGASDNKVNIKVGKTFKLQAAAKAESTKLKVKKFRALAYESSNKAVATVSNKGVIKAVSKGTCDVYVYAQNGVLVKIKVKVK